MFEKVTLFFNKILEAHDEKHEDNIHLLHETSLMFYDIIHKSVKKYYPDVSVTIHKLNETVVICIFDGYIMSTFMLRVGKYDSWYDTACYDEYRILCHHRFSSSNTQECITISNTYMPITKPTIWLRWHLLHKSRVLEIFKIRA